ncbi:MAG: 2,3-bisphosphoglycerate-dependent phosphoglycerate mutase, partial [Actinobacteria bacterium]|nr:2,3-bisphosphoglycerate-dependent phosphoglycerate mutase [Actinomycetota bacterium]
KDVVARVMPYLTGEVSKDMVAGKTVLITAHGNSLRAIVKHIDCISDTDIAKVNIPTGIPLYYEFDDDFEPITKGGRYLDPEAAKAAIEAVANQGKR